MPFQLTPFVRNLLIFNIVIYFGGQLLGLEQKIHQYFALYPFSSPQFLPFQLFTHMFLHAGLRHLLGNMLFLLIFGPKLEYLWGSRRFMIFYFICGIGAALLYSGVKTYEMIDLRNDTQVYLQKPTPMGFTNFVHDHLRSYYESEEFYNFSNEFELDPSNSTMQQSSKKLITEVYHHQLSVPMVGASGAIFGVLMAFGLLFPNTVPISFLFIPIPAKVIVWFFGVMELYRIWIDNPNDNVAHFAHLGGMLFAWIMIQIWKDRRDVFY